MEEVEAVRSTEEAKDLQVKSDRGLKLETMVRTEGWNTIFAPNLQGLQRQYEKDILTKRDHIDLITAQANINLIDQIFAFVENNITSGKEASVRLLENQKPE